MSFEMIRAKESAHIQKIEPKSGIAEKYSTKLRVIPAFEDTPLDSQPVSLNTTLSAGRGINPFEF